MKHGGKIEEKDEERVRWEERGSSVKSQDKKDGRIEKQIRKSSFEKE